MKAKSSTGDMGGPEMAPQFKWGPRHGPQTPNARSGPGNPGRSSTHPQRSERPGKPGPLLDPPPTLGAPRPSRGISRYSDRLLELDGQESAAQRPRHRLRAARRPELRQDGRDVKLHRMARDGEARGDDPVVGAVGHQLENLTLTRGQRRSRGRGAGRRRRQRLPMENEETGAYGAHGAGELLRLRVERQRRAQ